MNGEGKSEKSMLIASFAISFLIFICQIGKNGMMYLSTDELGQWATAAWLAGYDWSPISSHNSYYSYFYALPLSILFRLCQSPFFMYRMATILNALLLSSIVFLAYGICKKICGKQGLIFYCLIALNCTLFTSNIIMANLTWGESLLIAVSWLVLYLIVDVFNDSTIKSSKLFSLACLLMIGYMTHQRFLGVLLSGILVVCFAFMSKRISKKQVVFFLAVIGILMVFHSIMKSNVQEYVYVMKDGQIDGNDYSGQVSKLSRLGTIQGIFTLFQILIGHFYYIGVSTGYLGYLGIIYLIRRLKSSIIQKEWGKPGNFYPCLFITLAGGATVAIGSIFFMGAWRIDHVIYGRYNEIILGFLLLLGWLELKEKGDIREILGVAFVGGLISIITIYSIELLISSDAIQPICIGGIALLWHKGFRIMGIYGWAIFLLFLMAYLMKKKKNICHVMALVGITGVFVVSGLYVNEKIVFPVKQNWQGLVDLTESPESEREEAWVWLEDGTLKLEEKTFGVNVMPSLFQFLLKDRSLYYVEEKELNAVDLSHTNILTKVCPIYLPGFQAVDRKDDIYLVKKSYDTNSGEENILPLEWFSSHGSDEEEFRSYGKAEAVLFGPYITLRPGRYIFEVHMKVFGGNEVLGNIDAVSGDDVLYETELRQSDLKADSCVVQVPVVISETCPRFELRVMTAEGIDLQIEKIYFEYEEEKRMNK